MASRKHFNTNFYAIMSTFLRSVLFLTLTFLTFYESECVTCTFMFTYSNPTLRRYGCQLNNQIVENESDLNVVDGIHEIGHTNAHVTWISSNNSRISFFPSRLTEHFPNVTEMIFDESQMTSFGSVGRPISCDGLDLISLNDNLLSNIPDGVFSDCAQLGLLHLNGNNLNAIGEHAFAGLTDLGSLYLMRCNLSSIHPNAFQFLVNLTGIDLRTNYLQTLDSNLFRNCPRLQVVQMIDNRITALPDNFFINNRDLAIVDLSQNRITSLGPKLLFGGSFMVLGYYNLSYNLIEELSVFDAVPRLRELHLNNNKIRKTLPDTFAALNNLFVLRLNNNEIEDLQPGTFGEYPNFLYLFLNSNNISDLPANSFGQSRIDELWLDDNQLSHLNASSFSSMFSLSRLNVERNRIESIDPRLFDVLPYLGRLSLTGNVCADDTFSRNYDRTWPRMGTCSSVKIQTNLIAFVLIVLLKHLV